MGMKLSTDAIFANELAIRNSEQHPSISIISEPADVTTHIGAHVSLAANIVALKPKYQWLDKFGNPIPRTNVCCLTFEPVKEEDFGLYRLLITDEISHQIALTNWVEMRKSPNRNTVQPKRDPCTVSIRPQLLVSPTGGMFQLGCSIVLAAIFKDACNYQWYHNGCMMPGCNDAYLIIEKASLQNEGKYVLVARNQCGPTVCNGIHVKVTPLCT